MIPTLAGFIAWLYPAMGVTTAQLPTNSPFIGYAYNVAITLVNPYLQQVPTPAPNQGLIYMLAVYNLGASNLLNWCPDTPPSTFFADARKGYGINSFVAGVVTASSDEGTSNSLTTPEWASNLTIANLQQLKDPFGRQYLAFAADYGSLWGIS